MLQYPSIPGSVKAPLGKPCIAFYKYDGSNLRWEWSPKQGWNKYGTRRQLFDESDSTFGPAIPIFLEKIADDLVYRVKQVHKNPQRITAFTEYFGKKSFAGSHEPDDPKTLKLFDVFLFQKAFIKPKDFVEMFEDTEYGAEVVYTGQMNRQFIMDVRSGKYPVFEGVICKGHDWTCKVKTSEYFERLRHKYDSAWENYAE